MCTKHATRYDYNKSNPALGTTSRVDESALEWCRKAEEKAMTDENQTEDCLYLDVFVPPNVLPGDKKQESPRKPLAPVVVSFGTTPFIYGSKDTIAIGGPSPAVLTRHSPLPDEDSCPTQYPIVVSVNYRLGLFGWFADQHGTPNLGLWDQRLALEWVNRHIRTFGGDPDRITLVGMGSGGGGSIMHQVVAFAGKPNPHTGPDLAEKYNKAEAPFQQAIIMSPTWDFFPPDLNGTHLAVMDAASNISDTHIYSLKQLKKLSSPVLMNVNRNVVKEAPVNKDVFGPVVGGEFVPAHPGVLLRDKKFDPNLKIIVGRGYFHHLRTAPFGHNSVYTHTQLYEFFHGLSWKTLGFIFEELYNKSAIKDLSRRYTKRGSKIKSPTGVPPTIEDELRIMEEIMVGCNTRNLARAWNTSYAYDSLDYSPTSMMGLFSQAKNKPPKENETKPFSYRTRFLHFIEGGAPSVLGRWGTYGSKHELLGTKYKVRKDDEKKVLVPFMEHDFFDNERCDWWVNVGYEKLQAERGSWFKE